MNERLRDALRRKIEAHNKLIIASTIGGSLCVVVLWAILCFVMWWLSVLFLTVSKGVEAEMPQHSSNWITTVVLAWFALGFADRYLHRNASRDTNSSFEKVLKIVLLPVRVTFAVWDNYRNHIRLSEPDLECATTFLERVFRVGGMTTDLVDGEFPNEQVRDRIVDALKILDLIYIRNRKDDEFLSLSNPQKLLKFLEAEPTSSP